jgi:hypothetical protein
MSQAVADASGMPVCQAALVSAYAAREPRALLAQALPETWQAASAKTLLPAIAWRELKEALSLPVSFQEIFSSE